jgi:ProP effector
VSPDATRMLWAMLTQRYPQAFPLDASLIRPLKIGVREDILAAHPEMDPLELGRVLTRWCWRPRYWRVLAAGSPRIDLTGQPAGEVSPEQARHAQETLKARTEKEKRRKAAATKTPEARSVPTPCPQDIPPVPVRVPSRPILSLKRRAGT